MSYRESSFFSVGNELSRIRVNEHSIELPNKGELSEGSAHTSYSHAS